MIKINLIIRSSLIYKNISYIMKRLIHIGNDTHPTFIHILPNKFDIIDILLIFLEKPKKKEALPNHSFVVLGRDKDKG